MDPAEAAAALAAFEARVDPRDPAQAELLAAIKAATRTLAPAWRLSNPLPAVGAPPPGAADSLAAYIQHVAQEAADGRADDVALAVLEEGERGGELEWKQEPRALPDHGAPSTE